MVQREREGELFGISSYKGTKPIASEPHTYDLI